MSPSPSPLDIPVQSCDTRPYSLQISSLLIFSYVLCDVRDPLIRPPLRRFIESLVGEAPPGIRELGGCYAIEGSKIVFIDFCTLIFQETGWRHLKPRDTTEST
jgi:hypothetical protein